MSAQLPPEIANNPALLRLYHKQQEYSGLQALKEATEGMLSKADLLAEQSNMMADGGEGGCGAIRGKLCLLPMIGKKLSFWATGC